MNNDYSKEIQNGIQFSYNVEKYFAVLKSHNKLSAAGQGMLEIIYQRHQDLRSELSDVDRLGGTITGLQFLDTTNTDISELESIEPDKRLSKMREFISPHQKSETMLTLHHNNLASAYINKYPLDLLLNLESSQDFPADAKVWEYFLASLPVNNPQARELIPLDVQQEIFDRVFAFLEDKDLAPLANCDSELARCWINWDKDFFARKDWFIKLIDFCMKHANIIEGDSKSVARNVNVTADIWSKVFSSGAGLLTDAIIVLIDKHRKAKENIPDDLLSVLHRLIEIDGNQAIYIKSRLVRDFNFLMGHLKNVSKVKLIEMVNKSDVGVNLRRILIFSSISVNAEHFDEIHSNIIKSLWELDSEIKKGQEDQYQHTNVKIGRNIAIPFIFIRESNNLTLYTEAQNKEIQDLLQNGHPMLRNSVIEYFRRVLFDLHKEKSDKLAFWQESIMEFLQQFWPHDLSIKQVSTAALLVELVIQMGDQFPAAWKFAKPWIEEYKHKFRQYLTNPDPDYAAKLVLNSQNPDDLIDFIWTILPTDPNPSRYFLGEIPKILPALKEKYPQLLDDRRYQNLMRR